jgi:hypothetical protein
MTPKEKAIELVNIFRKFTDGTDPETHRYRLDIEKENAKQCALITVEEILSAHLFDENEKEYWQQVRTEIANL